MWTFEICTNWEEICSEEYQKEWNDLLNYSFCPHVFFTPDLVKAWMTTYLELRKITPLFIWAKNKDEDNKAFIPFVLWQKNYKNCLIKSIIPVGYSDFDYHDPIFLKQPIDISNFWVRLIEFLKKQKFDNIIIDGIRNIGNNNDILWIQNDICPYLDLKNIKTENDLMMFFKTSLRGDIRRQIRRLNEIGKLSLTEYKSFPETKNTFQQFINEHSLKWPNAYKAPHFHENLLKFGLGSVVHFSSLDIDDKPIAWHLGFEYKNTYYYYMPAGNHIYSKYSPVKIHLYYLLLRSIDKEGCSIYDHLRGDENYKSGLSNGIHYVHSTIFENISISSLAKIKLNNFLRTITRK